MIINAETLSSILSIHPEKDNIHGLNEDLYLWEILLNQTYGSPKQAESEIEFIGDYDDFILYLLDRIIFEKPFITIISYTTGEILYEINKVTGELKIY